MIERLRKLCCAVLAMALFMIPVNAWAGNKAVVATRYMKVYRSKNSVAGQLPQGTVVTVLSKADGVARISYKGKKGYALLDDLKSLKQTEVCVSDAVVYQSASKRTRSVSVSRGTKVNVVAISGDWAKIERDGKYGYIEKDKLALYAYKKDDTNEQTEVGIVIAAAAEKLGCKYVYGNSGPNVFDCSGFTKYVFKKVGTHLSGSAHGQGYGKGEKISYADLKAGDIVCFDTVESDTDQSDHVGIYLGDGEFIHASSAKGEVIISSMKGGYYKRTFSWGRRVL